MIVINQTMFHFLVLVVLVHSLTASPCSQLDLTTSNTNNFDENYSIVTETLKSSNVLKISLRIKQIMNENSWFVMGASDSSNLIGSWEPFTPADGQVIECSSSSEQAVTNQDSVSENPNRLEFTFYWMAPPSFNSMVTFIATIIEQDTSNDKSLVRYIQSTPTQIVQKQGRDRYQDVSQCKFFDSIF